MALHWQWNEKMGECTYENGHKSNLYRGNAFIIATNEFEDDTYNLAWFAVDETHMKNMLGLTKGYDNIFKDWGITEIKLDTRYKETAKFIQMIAKSKTAIRIELY